MTSVTHQIGEAGRAHLARIILQSGKEILAVNVHNFELKQETMEFLGAPVRASLADSAQVPKDRSLLLTGGDWDFHSADDSPTLLTSGGRIEVLAPRRRPQGLRAMDDLLEIHQANHTCRRQPMKHDGTCETHLAEIDRFYIGIPSAAVVDIAIRADTRELPHRRGPLSDHVPVCLSLSSQAHGQSAARPRLRWVYRTKEYATMARDAVTKVVAKVLHPNDLLRRTKQALHSAAAAAHRLLLSRPSAGPEVRASAALEVARAISRQRPQSFWAACRAAPSLADFVTKTDDGDAVPHDSDGLYAHIAELVRPLSAPMGPMQAGGHRRASRNDMTVERWRKHWTPLTCRRFLAGFLNVPGSDGAAPAPDTSPAPMLSAPTGRRPSQRGRSARRSSRRCFATRSHQSRRSWPCRPQRAISWPPCEEPAHRRRGRTCCPTQLGAPPADRRQWRWRRSTGRS